MERTETPAQRESRRSTEIPVPVAAAPAPYSAAAQRAGSSDRRTEAFRGQEAERGLRAGGLRRGQASAEHTASGTDGFESERSAEPGGRIGGNADRPPAPRSTPTA